MLEQLPREAVDAPSIPGGVQGQLGWGPGSFSVEVGGPACYIPCATSIVLRVGIRKISLV